MPPRGVTGGFFSRALSAACRGLGRARTNPGEQLQYLHARRCQGEELCIGFLTGQRSLERWKAVGFNSTRPFVMWSGQEAAGIRAVRSCPSLKAEPWRHGDGVYCFLLQKGVDVPSPSSCSSCDLLMSCFRVAPGHLTPARGRNQATKAIKGLYSHNGYNKVSPKENESKLCPLMATSIRYLKAALESWKLVYQNQLIIKNIKLYIINFCLLDIMQIQSMESLLWRFLPSGNTDEMVI